jgi:hypothetical protein
MKESSVPVGHKHSDGRSNVVTLRLASVMIDIRVPLAT